ncbi:MAG: hypothetical protein L6R36_009493 [Xanthoria steineri]|nr:MAG: hypothetical protein L6R36_009493 [Xanthoria steineri]
MGREHHRPDTRHHKVVLPNPRYRNLVLPESEMQKVFVSSAPVITLMENFSNDLDARTDLAHKTELYRLHQNKL